MVHIAEVRCESCGWKVEIEKEDKHSAEIAASAKSAAHVATEDDCPYGSTDYEIEEKE